MITKSIATHSDLINILKDDIEHSNKENITLFAGHLPMLYDNKTTGLRHASLGLDRWGEFSLYSFELGCQIAKFAIDNGKKTSLAVIVDDLVEIPRAADGSRKTKHWMKSAQRRFYSQNSLPVEYVGILEKYGVQNTVLSQQRSFGTSKLISEAKLKSDALRLGISAPNECSMAYNAFLNDSGLFNAATDYLISFVPGQCKGNICTGVLEVRQDLSASHIFFPHIEVLGGLFDSGKGFIQMGSKASIRDIYDIGLNYMKS